MGFRVCRVYRVYRVYRYRVYRVCRVCRVYRVYRVQGAGFRLCRVWGGNQDTHSHIELPVGLDFST